MIRVYPSAANPSHDFSLSDGVETWGLRLDGGPDALREEPLTPSTLRLAGLTGFGSWEPGLAQIEQRDWSGGRGAERFSMDDAELKRRFYDSMNAWTLKPGVLLAAPQWKLARGLRNAVQHLPGSVHWQGIFGSQRWLSAKFTIGAADMAPAQVRVWLRRVGSPGAISLRLTEDEDGLPAAALSDAGGVATIAEVTDVISRFHSFDVSGYGGSLSAGIDYHVVLSASPTDNAANHWEVGVHKDFPGGHSSNDGTVWATTKFCFYHRIEDVDIERSFLFFQFGGAFYAVDQRANGNASHLYINGDRGLATSVTATTIEDADKDWSPDVWSGAWVRIVKGKGVGQARQVISNTAMDLVVAAWKQIPDATSEYAIYATDIWRDISPTSGDVIDGVITDVALLDDHVLFAQGASVPMLRMRFNTSLAVPAHEFADEGANVADRLHVFHHSAAGPQIYRAMAANSEVSRATPTAWGTALTFSAAIKVGEKSAAILELLDHNGELWALKTNGAWTIDEDDKAHQTALNLEMLPITASQIPISEIGEHLLLGWGKALLEYSGGALSEIVSPELPASRCGSISALLPLSPALLAVAIDGGVGESSVLVFTAGAWHELMRAPQPGQRILALGLQSCPGAHSRLWIHIAGDLAFVDLPHEIESPLADPGLAYQHETVLVSGTVDMGAALLPKFLEQLTLSSSNLSRGLQVSAEFQVDSQIGTGHWQSAGSFYSSPLDCLSLHVGPLHAIRTRLRLLTSEATRTPIVRATVLEGFARTPLKYRWTMRIRLADLQNDRAGAIDPGPDAFMLWLLEAARQARKIVMRSVWSALDDKYVIVEPLVIQREYLEAKQWGGTATVVLREV